MMCFWAVTTMMANPISENQARSVASNFMTRHAMPPTTLKMAKKGPQLSAATTGEAHAAYYVFNNTVNGFVIVAGDDRAPAVLGYSDKGTFDAANIPEGLQELLEGYTAQITALNKGGQSVKLNSSGEAISPMLTSAWSQNAPYNTLLPMVTDTKRAVAGCVGTAMAQIMYYWKYPTQVTTTLPEYTTQTLGIFMPALEPVEFNWEAMQDTYLSTDTESEEALAAAQLTLYCDQAIQMNFLYNSSSGYTNRIPNVISTYFGYKASAHCEYRENYSTQSWNDFVYNELAEGRPVVYSGSKASSGHAFICDGYDGEGMFHINWGWDGMSNGYFLLNVLNPDAQGTGSASEAYGYIYGQFVVCGIEPGEGEGEFVLTASDVALNGAVTTRTSSNANFKATVTGHFWNYTERKLSVSFGWGLYDGETLLSTLYSSGGNLTSGYYYSTNSEELSFGRNITSGTYRIVPIYSELGMNNWRPCKGADVNYIEVTINDNNCTVIGYGTAGERSYTLNGITYDGTLHHGRPVDLALNLTNDGYSQSDLLYMFVNDNFYSTGFVGLEHGETGDVTFRYLPSTPGDYTFKFSFNEDGSDPLCYTTLTITEMPAVYLYGDYEVLNLDDEDYSIINDNKFRLKLTITNYSPEAVYDDDITVKLYKRTNETSGNNAQIMNKSVSIEPYQTIEVEFDLENVIDGWDYFAAATYYSSGQQYRLCTTSFYTIVFPEEPVIPDVMLGDVDGDGNIGIKDVTVLIDYLLGSNPDEFVFDNADLDGNGDITIADVTALIDMLLMH